IKNSRWTSGTSTIGVWRSIVRFFSERSEPSFRVPVSRNRATRRCPNFAAADDRSDAGTAANTVHRVAPHHGAGPPARAARLAPRVWIRRDSRGVARSRSGSDSGPGARHLYRGADRARGGADRGPARAAAPGLARIGDPAACGRPEYP